MTPVLNKQSLELSSLTFSRLRKRFILGYCLKAFVKSGELPLPCLGLPNELCLPVPGLETREERLVPPVPQLGMEPGAAPVGGAGLQGSIFHSSTQPELEALKGREVQLEESPWYSSIPGR
jgi:hypothetical protein